MTIYFSLERKQLGDIWDFAMTRRGAILTLGFASRSLSLVKELTGELSHIGQLSMSILNEVRTVVAMTAWPERAYKILTQFQETYREWTCLDLKKPSKCLFTVGDTLIEIASKVNSFFSTTATIIRFSIEKEIYNFSTQFRTQLFPAFSMRVSRVSTLFNVYYVIPSLFSLGMEITNWMSLDVKKARNLSDFERIRYESALSKRECLLKTIKVVSYTAAAVFRVSLLVAVGSFSALTFAKLALISSTIRLINCAASHVIQVDVPLPLNERLNRDFVIHS